ncbi:MAG: JDVT-CTERM system glutamic-type intramembrane protease [Alcanivoracaceae bacterium]|nr:JDVT-CTERM system glutamic-type intramembrane protease [Alcanivoracaceae bacterium]
MDLSGFQSRPTPLRDKQLLVALIGTVLAGVGLYHWLPQGYAADITGSLWLTLNVALLYPVVEELLFRGVIQGELLRREKTAARHFGVSRANMLTSILFTCLHLVHQAPLWAASVMLPSLVLGHFRERYNNLIAPILLHILFNAAWLSASIASN